MSDTRNLTVRDQLAEALEQVVADLNNRGAISDGYGWTEIADALLASDAIAAVRAAAVAETTATIEAATAPMLSIAAQAVRSAYSDDAEELSSALTMTGLHLRDVLDNLRAALSGGRTALDTTLNQARAELREQIARGIEDSRDRNQGNPAALAYLTHAAAIARHGRVEGADQ